MSHPPVFHVFFHPFSYFCCCCQQWHWSIAKKKLSQTYISLVFRAKPPLEALRHSTQAHTNGWLIFFSADVSEGGDCRGFRKQFTLNSCFLGQLVLNASVPHCYYSMTVCLWTVIHTNTGSHTKSPHTIYYLEDRERITIALLIWPWNVWRGPQGYFTHIFFIITVVHLIVWTGA